MRNPKWEKDELILALDLYFRHNPSNISTSHEEIIKLSQILNSLPIHKERPNQEVFRNPNGVYMKMCNFLRFDPNYSGVGLQRGGKLEEEVWNEYANNTQHLRKIAHNIISGTATIPNNSLIISDEENDFPEGKVLYRLHKLRERNSSLIIRAKRQALEQGNLKCQICGFDFYKEYGEIGKGYIECHHTTPVSEYDQVRNTSISDIALVCSNCHRMLHRKRPWLSVAELNQIMNKEMI